jgi:hypothetical protein
MWDSGGSIVMLQELGLPCNFCFLLGVCVDMVEITVALEGLAARCF